MICWAEQWWRLAVWNEDIAAVVTFVLTESKETNPQTCLFSATLPVWVYKTAKKYMRDSLKKVDLIGQQVMRTATTVQVGLVRAVSPVVGERGGMI